MNTKKRTSFAKARAGCRTAWAAALLLAAPSAFAGEIAISSIDVRHTAQTVSLGMTLDFDDPQQQIPRALLRGDVWLELDVSLHRHVPWWSRSPRQVGHIRVVYRLLYDSLEQRYQVHRIHSQETLEFPTLDESMKYLSRPSAIPVVRLDLLPKKRGSYYGRVQARLFANTLPLIPYDSLVWRSDPVSWTLP